MREKLIELIWASGCVETWDYYTDDFKKLNPIETLADHLIENGVIVPPCKVGDTIYMLVTKKTHSFDLKSGERRENQHTFIKKTILMESNFFRVIRDYGKTVFLTKAGAQAALKGGAE
jgi:hypothetical protein